MALIDSTLRRAADAQGGPYGHVRVVVQYVTSQPARMNDNFDALAVEALRKAWPCSNP
jgi:hypothetical protein